MPKFEDAVAGADRTARECHKGEQRPRRRPRSAPKLGRRRRATTPACRGRHRVLAHVSFAAAEGSNVGGRADPYPTACSSERSDAARTNAAVSPLRVRVLDRVRGYAHPTILAKLACALARARAVPIAAQPCLGGIARRASLVRALVACSSEARLLQCRPEAFLSTLSPAADALVVPAFVRHARNPSRVPLVHGRGLGRARPVPSTEHGRFTAGVQSGARCESEEIHAATGSARAGSAVSASRGGGWETSGSGTRCHPATVWRSVIQAAAPGTIGSQKANPR